MNKISIIIPVFNAEKFLTESIRSITNQSYKDIEIICVNDGSTDNSLTLLNNFAKKDDRIIVVNKENGGCGSARNHGLIIATGKYVYFFDPDDYVMPTALEELHNNAENNKSDIVLSQIAWYSEGNKTNYDKPGFNFDEIFPDADFDDFTFSYKEIISYVLNSYFAPWTKLYKKEFLDEYNFRFEEKIAFDDVPFHVETMIKAKRISFVKKAFYHYRTSNKNSVNNTVSNAIDIMRICDIVEIYLRKNNYYDEFESEFLRFKITQLNLYIIFSNSESYYKYTKNEFLKMNLKGKNLPEDIIKKHELVVSSENYEEYRQIRNAPPIKDEKRELLNRINELERKSNELIIKNKKLNDEYSNLKEKYCEMKSSKIWKFKKIKNILGI